jgi:hypothetical protein
MTSTTDEASLIYGAGHINDAGLFKAFPDFLYEQSHF